jgi:3,4-dihydroxy 2-butanone 4-phosphate synthase/GTP cyclohydrolase II
MAFCTVEEAVAELGLGKFVLLMDDDGRHENKVHLAMAARFATPEKVAFALRNTAG